MTADVGRARRQASTREFRRDPSGQHLMCVGAFDDPTPFRLVGEIYIDRKPPGYAFTGDHPRLTEAETLAKFAPPEDKGAE